MAPRKGKKEKTEEVQVQLGPQVREGDEVFAVAHIYASFNDTFVHVTDLSGRYVKNGHLAPFLLAQILFSLNLSVFHDAGVVRCAYSNAL